MSFLLQPWHLLFLVFASWILFGERSLRNAIREFVEHHYPHERNHQGLENKIIQPDDQLGSRTGDIKSGQRLGGMLRYYYRDAA